MGSFNIGKYTYGNPIRRGESNTINIGKFCSIAEGVILDGGFQHNTKFISTFPFSTKFEGCEIIPTHVVNKGDINIGNDVWIGEGACIMGGVTIGDGAVIGFRSIISKDVDPYAIIVGAPQKVLRYRFSEEHINLLLNIKWWDWEEQKIIEASKYLMSDNIDKLNDFYIKNIVT